jgi:hypothetical protein
VERFPGHQRPLRRSRHASRAFFWPFSVSSVSLWFSPPCLRGGVARAETGGSFCGRNFFVDRVWGSDSTWIDNSHDLGVAQACVERCGSTHPDPPTRIHPPGSTHPDRLIGAVVRVVGPDPASTLAFGGVLVSLRGGLCAGAESALGAMVCLPRGWMCFPGRGPCTASCRGTAAGGCGSEVFSRFFMPARLQAIAGFFKCARGRPWFGGSVPFLFLLGCPGLGGLRSAVGLVGVKRILGLSLDGFDERAGLGLSGMGRLLES